MRWGLGPMLIVMGAVGLLSLAPLGCGHDAPPTPPPPPDPPAPQKAQAERRIVSLVPALTQMLMDLELADELVGVAEHDMAAPAGVPTVGSFAMIDYERLIGVAPTLVLTVASKESPPPRLVELADALGFELYAYPYPHTLDDVLTTLASSPPPKKMPGLGEVLGIPDRAWALRESVAAQLGSLSRQTAGRAWGEPEDPEDGRPSVLICFSTHPQVMASGPGTLNDGLLALLHATNAAGGATVTAPSFDREALQGMAPDVIVLLMPGSPPLTTHDPRLTPFAGLAIPAVTEGRLYLINDPLCLLPSTSLPAIAQEMARAIYGPAFGVGGR